jgi:hypothetical protein
MMRSRDDTTRATRPKAGARTYLIMKGEKSQLESKTTPAC